MAIKIGHASIDENGKAKGGSAGDQTGKEVCVRTWYSKPWDYVLRCKDSGIAEKMAKACEKGCANSNIGYDQNQRNTLHTYAKKAKYDLSKVTTKCETDCSAFMTVCAIAGGITELEYSDNAPTTSTMKTAFQKTGKFTVLTDSKYLTADTYLKRGDILVKSGSHTVMALENGSGVKASSTSTTKTKTSKTTTTTTTKASTKSKTTIKVGNTVKINKGAKSYTGGTLASFVYGRKYKVKELKNDRAVLTYNGTVTAAINVKDLTLV